jgi:hypothetical protein
MAGCLTVWQSAILNPPFELVTHMKVILTDTTFPQQSYISVTPFLTV